MDAELDDISMLVEATEEPIIDRSGDTRKLEHRLDVAERSTVRLEAERDAKVQRETELQGLLEERTAAATKLQEELAKQGGIKEKYDFSMPSAREAGSSSAAGSSADHAAASSRSAPAPNMDDALFAFVSAGGRGGLRIGQSGTNHSLFGNNGSDGLAAALRF